MAAKADQTAASPSLNPGSLTLAGRDQLDPPLVPLQCCNCEPCATRGTPTTPLPQVQSASPVPRLWADSPRVRVCGPRRTVLRAASSTGSRRIEEVLRIGAKRRAVNVCWIAVVGETIDALIVRSIRSLWRCCGLLTTVLVATGTMFSPLAGPPVGREEVDGASRERGRCGGWRQATREQAAAPGGEETGGAEVAGVEPWSRASVADDGGGAAMAGIVPTGGATSRAAAAACAGSDSCVSSSSWRRRRRRHQGS
uniref:Uncharacterized protein n=1 Tax=Oryza nivara TaxID=4536 RepID=A0A0E0HKQ6_ORYNI